MNSRQRNVVVVALAVAALMVLFPPRERSGSFVGYTLFLDGWFGASVSLSLLLTQFAALAFAGGAAWFACRDRDHLL
jgi:ABC-type uncharacterized transport system permease subunit